MNPRKPEEVRENLRIARELFISNKFHQAFDYYKGIHDDAQYPHLKLFCRARMLFCQFSKKTIVWQKVIINACDLINELKIAIAADTSNKKLFQDTLREMQKLNDMLGSREKKYDYLCSLIKLSIVRVNEDTFFKYAAMMEIDVGRQTYEIDYLNALYNELKKTEVKNELRAKLAETIGFAYRTCGDDADDQQTKKQLLKLAKESFEKALFDWRSIKSYKGEQLLSSILFILQELYDLAEDNEVERAQVLVSVRRILASDEFTTMPAKEVNKKIRKDIEADVADHREWFEGALSRETEQQRKYIDKLLMPSPPAKKRRLGTDIYAAPDATPVVVTETASLMKPSVIV